MSIQSEEALPDRFVDSALAGDVERCWAAVENALSERLSVVGAYVDLIAPALRRVGDLWHEGEITAADEHLATQTVLRVMERLRRRGPRSASRHLDAVVACVEGEQHEIGGLIVADLLEMDGWTVSHLGANTPTADLLGFVADQRPALVGLSATLDGNLDALVTVASNLRSMSPAPVLIAGGAAVQSAEASARVTPVVDAIAEDALHAVALARELAPRPSPSETPLDELLAAVGGNVRRLRLAMGLTQAELARASDLDRAYVSALENGKQNVTVAALLRVGRTLTVDLSTLVQMSPQ